MRERGQRENFNNLPNESSAIIVSHCSPKSLIANMITKKPVHLPSLKQSILLNHTRNIGLATPTLIRKGLPIKVIRGMENLDLNKLKDLLEQLFKTSYFACLEASLRFVFLAGDYQASAIVKDEKEQNNQGQERNVCIQIGLNLVVIPPCLQQFCHQVVGLSLT
jgi:amino-acid N-acetyltransferase